MDLKTIQKAQATLAPFVHPSPLIRCYALEKRLGCKERIFLKCEQLHTTGSFKVRGAFNALLSLSSEEKRRGVITRSAGNFGAALAFAGKELQIPVTIILPESVPKAKLNQMVSYGAETVLKKTRQEEEETVKRLAQEKNLVPLSPYNHLAVIAGQGTIALEIFDAFPTIRHFFCPLGGGGLLCGIGVACKALDPKIQIIGIEPNGANDYLLSRKAKKKITLEKVTTIADGLVAPTVGDLNYPILEQCVDTVETVPDEKIIEAMRFLYDEVGMIIEPSGATSVAGLMAHKRLDGDAVCILSGCNVDKGRFYAWVAKNSPAR